MSVMRVIVCGGRDFEDLALLFRELDELHRILRFEVLAHGHAPGADRLAALWAMAACVPMLSYPADWQTHGRAAGPIRNQRMLDEFAPTMVVAFPGGRGTADMVRRARAAGVPVVEVPR